MTTNYKKNRNSKGLATIFTVIALPFLLIIAGLAIDSGRAYSMQAKLFAAVDAAGIAAARAVSGGELAATAAATKYFNVNISPALASSNPSLSNINYSYDSDGNISIDLNATADMPTSFIRLLGFETWGVGAQAQTVRRPVDLVLVVDNSSSLRGSGTTGGQDVTAQVISQSKAFLSNFNPAFDRVSVVKYANGAEVPVPFANSRGHNATSVQNAIDAFTFISSNGGSTIYHYTNTSEGFYRALQQFNPTDPNSASLKVIVFFTDGTPTAFSANFNFDGTPTNGAIYARSSTTPSNGARGLWRTDRISEQLSGSYEGNDIENHISILSGDETEGGFGLFDGRRTVSAFSQGGSNTDLWNNIQQISRNLPEEMAESARNNDIFVFTLGLGSALTELSGKAGDQERGEYLLYRMANDPAMQNNSDLASDFDSTQKQGVYCYAVDEDALGPCFDKMLDVIIRLTL